jgi:tripartite-type tricarboxylate transporter receptor subunit TctC
MRTIAVFSRLSAVTLASLFLACAVAAEPWPRQAVRVILPVPPGGGADAAARIVGERLAERWGKPVVIENRQGADGIPAVTSVLAANDGHTLLFSFAGVITINPVLHSQLPYDPVRDLVPIASLADNFLTIAVSATLPVHSLDDLVNAARDAPGKLNWAATPGIPQYVFLALQQKAQIELARVPYANFAPALQDLADGRIHVVVTGLPLVLPQAHAGKANLLVVTNRERSPTAPQVPTAHELGYPELTFDGIVGFYGPRTISPELRERIAHDVRAVALEPAVGAQLQKAGLAVNITMLGDFERAIEDQGAKVNAVTRRAPAQR